MAPTNVKTVHQTSLLHLESSLDRLGLLPPTHDQRSQQQSGQNTLQPVLIKQVQVPQGHTSYKNQKNWNTEVHGGGGLELVKPAREPASSRPKPRASLKTPHESCPFAAPCGSRRKKNDRGQISAFPSETSRFAPLILAHKGSALPWLVDERAALRIRRISVRTHPIEHYQAPVLPPSRVPPPSRRAPNWSLEEARTWNTILSQSYRRRVSTDRPNREGS